MALRINVLWAFLGIPLSAITLLYGIYSHYNQKKIKLKNKVVFITGASSGLGRACAKAFYLAGCRLVLSGRDVQKLQDLRNELAFSKECGDYHTLCIVNMDLEEIDSLRAKVEAVISCFGQVDILINNAGQSYRGMALHTKLEVDKKLMDVNYFAHIEITKAILPHMVRRRSGHIVAIGSVQSRVAIPHRTAYTASKHAFQAYFDSLRAEVAGQNITVCVVNPHYIQTKLSQNAVTADGSNYGKMDETTKSGLRPDYVAQKVVQCVKNGTQEKTVAPFYVQVVIALRTMCPWLYFKIMEHRAKVEQDKMHTYD